MIPTVQQLFDFSGRAAIVTGAGSGIGPGIALRFAEAGAAVMVHYRRSGSGAEAVARQIRGAGGQAAVCRADLTRADDVEALMRSTLEAFGRLDVLINNAGHYPKAGLIDMTEAEWDDVIDANLRSVFLCTQAAARHMQAPGSGGAVVNVTSIEAENPAAGHAHYNAAKAGVAMFTRAAALELGPHGIRVNAVAPGLIWTDGLDERWPEGLARWRAAAPLGRVGQPQDVADACLFLASPAARWITGISLTVDGGVLTRQIY